MKHLSGPAMRVTIASAEARTQRIKAEIEQAIRERDEAAAALAHGELCRVEHWLDWARKWSANA